MTTRRCRLYIDEYMEAIESGEIPASKRLRKAMPYIRSKLDAPGVYIDEEKTKKAVELIEKYFEIKLVPWELFIIALVHAYHEDGTLLFMEFFILVGRGIGKNKMKNSMNSSVPSS